MIRVDWFLQEVVCAIFHRLHGFVNRAEGSHDDDGHVRVGGARSTQHVQAGSVWHSQVSEDKTVTRIRDLIERRAGIDRFRYAVSGILEGQSQYATQTVFVFDK